MSALVLCGSCGAAPFRTSGTCTVCSTRLPDAPLLAPAVGAGAELVAMLLSLACAGCQQRFAVRELADNASTTCGLCGKAQTVPFPDLKAAVALVRRTAQSTPDKKTRGQGVAAEQTSGRFHVVAYRGHPLCASCHRPHTIALGDPETRAGCEPCGTVVAYRRHPIFWRAGEKEVVATLAPFAAAARRDFDVTGENEEDESAAVALRCPGCGAAADEPDRRVIKCRFCDVVAWVPDRAWSARHPRDPVWLVIRAR